MDVKSFTCNTDCKCHLLYYSNITWLVPNHRERLRLHSLDKVLMKWSGDHVYRCTSLCTSTPQTLCNRWIWAYLGEQLIQMFRRCKRQPMLSEEKGHSEFPICYGLGHNWRLQNGWSKTWLSLCRLSTSLMNYWFAVSLQIVSASTFKLQVLATHFAVPLASDRGLGKPPFQ